MANHLIYEWGGQTFNIGTVPGRIISKGVAEDPNAPDVRIWRIRRDYQTADLTLDAAELNNIPVEEVTEQQIQAVRQQYENDWKQWPVEKGAPFDDANGNGMMDPGEEPGIAGADQVVWFVANDLDLAATSALYGLPPIGLEMQVTLWAYNRSDALGNVIFKRVLLIYKGTATTPDTAHIDSMFITQWSDPDLGTSADDLVGVDTVLCLGYVYNSTAQDEQFSRFNLKPPAMGYDFLQGSKLKTDNPIDAARFDFQVKHRYKNLPLTSFVVNPFISYPNLGGIPPSCFNVLRKVYDEQNGFMPIACEDGRYYVDPWGNPTKFPFNGDLVTGTGWLDGQTLPPGDRKFFLNSGPFTMALGDTHEVIIALVAALGGDHLSSISLLKLHDRAVQNLYDNFFELPKPPAAPKITISELDQKIILNWGTDSESIPETEDKIQDGYEFEGYNIYQLPSKNASLKEAVKIATFDRVNEVTTILETFFDSGTGLILKRPVQIGRNSGLKRFLIVTKDHVRNRPIVNGRPYYFAVTAYNFNPGNPPLPSLETPLKVQVAIPHAPKPGVRLGHAVGDTLLVEPVERGKNTVIAIVIDPSKTTGDTYRASIQKDTQSRPFWNLSDETTGELPFKNQTNFSGDDNYPLVDGLLVKVVNSKPISTDFFFTSLAPSFDRELAKEDVEKINVFPNPYVGLNRLETSRFQRFVTFSHLPRRAIIRIFNLAGTFVKEITKNDESPFVKWNLRNESNRLVASGLYLAHIEMPDLGKTRILKLAIVLEQID